ncbi:MAG: RNase adapter RapZ [Ruminococcaceae bacterium]|nr:RNase adapter RapZ [Oscillospiraceae bacterium]
MEVVVISGLSGAGKSCAAAIMEDLNYYCVDNMPTSLIPRFAEICMAAGEEFNRSALVVDTRGQHNFDKLFSSLDELEKLGCKYKILFIEADSDTIVKRYKETRRRHPLDPGNRSISDAVARESLLLEPVRKRADRIIDTTKLTLGMLQRILSNEFAGTANKSLQITVESFGFKHGIPIDADLVFDVRFLPNPYYVNELRHMRGYNKPVSDYVLNSPNTQQFLGHLKSLIEYLIPNYTEEGKYSLVICIGCTGGHHRSVAIAEELCSHLTALGHKAECYHRDADK